MPTATSIIVGDCMPGVSFFQTAVALEANRGEFAYVSELAAEGFEPFGTSGVGKTVFGMNEGGQIFLLSGRHARFRGRAPGNSPVIHAGNVD